MELSNRLRDHLHQLLILRKPFSLKEVRNIVMLLTYKWRVTKELGEYGVLGRSLFAKEQ